MSHSLPPHGQAPLSTRFPRQYWSGLPFSSPGDLPDPGIKPRSPAWQADSLSAEPQGKGVGLVRSLQPWDILLIYCNNQLKKYRTPFSKTSEWGTLCPPSDIYVRSFLCLFSYLIKLCCTKALEWSSLVPVPKAKSSEIMNPTLFTLSYHDPIDYTVHGILQARILEWVAIPFSRGSSQPRDQTQVSHTTGGFFTSWATREAQRGGWAGIQHLHLGFQSALTDPVDALLESTRPTINLCL